MKLFKKAKKGFTLVELVVVIAVIAILAAVSVGAYFGVTDSANRSKLEQEAKQTFEAIRLISLADPENNQNLGIDGLTLDTTEDGVAEFTNDLMYATGQTYTVSLEEKPQEGITGKTVVLYKNFLDLGTSNANGSNQTYKSFNYYTNEVKSYAANVNLINGKIEIISDEFEITPPPASTAVTGVSLNTTSYDEMVTGDTYTLLATVTPDTATDKSVTWSSSDSSVVTVNNGVVSAVGAGIATVTVTTTDGNKTASCTFTVEDPVIDAEAIGITTSAPENFYVGDDPITLEAQITPVDTTNKTITWLSSAPEIASVVAETGVVTPLAKGTAVITAKTHNNKTDTITIVVKQHATKVELDQESISMHVGDNDIQLNATVTPDNADNKNVTWKSSDESVATVNNGKVHAVGNGNATITVKTVDGEYTDTCSVSVSTHATSVTITQGDSVEVNENGTVQLSATVLPETSSYTTITWSSSDDTKATVDANGLVTAAANGKGQVTIKASCDGKEDQITVNILRPVSSLTLNKTTTSINVGEDETLVATFDPEAPSNPGITWASDSDAATVDQNGKVTAVKMGTATITASSVENNTIVASCVVTVIQPITLITLSASTLTLTEGEVSEALTYTVEPEENSFNSEVGEWSSSNNNIATVNAGVVTAVASGTATISFTKGNVSGTCAVTVNKAPVPVTGITISGETTVEVDSTITLIATVEPADADNKNVTWSANPESVATVDQNGVVTGVSEGTVTITATSNENNNIKATHEIVVKQAATRWFRVEKNQESSLKDGDYILIVHQNGNKIQTLNKQENSKISLSDNEITLENDGTLLHSNLTSDSYIFELDARDDGTFNLIKDNKYLNNSGSGANLTFATTQSDSTGWNFKSIFDDTAKAEIVNKASTNRKLLIQNDTRLGAYTGGNDGNTYTYPQIFKLSGELPEPELPKLESFDLKLSNGNNAITVAETVTVDFTNKLPSNANDPLITNVIIVSGNDIISANELQITALKAGTATIKCVDENSLVESSILQINVTENSQTTPVSKTVSYTVATTTSVKAGGTYSNLAATFKNTYTTADQITGSKSATLTLSGNELVGAKITGIVLNMHSNTSKGAGKFSAIFGTTSIASISSATNFNSWYDNNSYGTTYRPVNVALTNTSYVGVSGDELIIKIEATTNSLYINSYTITYSK